MLYLVSPKSISRNTERLRLKNESLKMFYIAEQSVWEVMLAGVIIAGILRYLIIPAGTGIALSVSPYIRHNGWKPGRMTFYRLNISIVFLLYHELNDLILYNKKVLLNALFSAVKHTLNLFSGDPKYGLVGQLGFTSVLHTWDQKMNLHYHLHCIVPAGVYNQTENHWVPARYKFLFPVKAMSKVFRGKYVSMVRNAYNNGKLNLFGKTAYLNDPTMFSQVLSSVMDKDWVVFTKAPFKSPRFVLDYLGRYTHRVAISNNRIIKVSDQRALFTYKKQNFKGQQYSCETKICNLEGEAFIQRFLLHELPSGFMRIRHFGFMGNNCKKNKLQRIRVSIGVSESPVKPTPKKSTA